MILGVAAICAAVVVALIATLSVRASRREAAKEKAFLARAKYVEGTIHRYGGFEDGRGRPLDEPPYAVILYKVDGFAYEIKDERERFGPDELGRKVKIAYDPKLPSESRIVG